MVECEYNGNGKCSKELAVLIDTWWNVNTFEFLAFTSCICVLIDTWWNVNSGNVINVFDKRIVLIDTWWNVNFI